MLAHEPANSLLLYSGSKLSRDLRTRRHQSIKRTHRRQLRTQLLQRGDQSLSRNIPHQHILRKRTAAQTADCPIEPPAAGLIRSLDLRRSLIVARMEMHTNLNVIMHGHHIRDEDRPRRTPAGTLALLARAHKAGQNIGALCDAMYERKPEESVAASRAC